MGPDEDRASGMEPGDVAESQSMGECLFSGMVEHLPTEGHVGMFTDGGALSIYLFNHESGQTLELNIDEDSHFRLREETFGLAEADGDYGLIAQRLRLNGD